MNKVWRIFVNEYLRHVLRKRFIFALLSLPIFVLAMVAVGLIIASFEYDGRPIGYVDSSGWLKAPAGEVSGAGQGWFADQAIIRFENENTARSALEQGQIQAYYVVSPDYLQTGSVRQVALEAPSETADSAFRKFLTAHLVNGLPAEVQEHLLYPDQVQIHSLDGSREMGGQEWLQFIIPILAGALFVVVINTSGGYLMQAVVEEKENRTMEIVITSVSPTQLMVGKTIGNLSVGLTQLIIWLMFPALALFLAVRFFAFTGQINFGFDYALLTLLTLAPAFILVAGLMAAIGATATESREAQQIAGMFTLPVVLPYWFIGAIITQPNSPLAIALSLFPLSAPVTLPLRAAFTTVPWWQSTLSIGLLFLSAAGSLWLAARAFRLGMLRYGKRLNLREIFARKEG